MAAPVGRLTLQMLRTIDGLHWSRVEFEERCALRSLHRAGVRVTRDENSIVRVDWTTITASTKGAE